MGILISNKFLQKKKTEDNMHYLIFIYFSIKRLLVHETMQRIIINWQLEKEKNQGDSLKIGYIIGKK